MGRAGGWEASKHLRVKQTIKRKKETKKTNSTNKQWPPQRPRNAKKNVSRSHEKLAKSRPKRTKNRPRSDLWRFGRINVVQGMATIAPKTAWDGLRTPSWVILAPKLAVLAAMLVVLDAKLAARDDPDNARSRPRALIKRARKLERCSRLFFVGF